MSDSLQIPIGADLAALQAAFSQIQSHVTRMGEKITGSLAKTNSSINQTAASAGKIQKSFSRAWQLVSQGAAAAFRGMITGAKAAADAIRSALSGVMGIAGKIGKAGLLGGGLVGGLGLGALVTQGGMLAGSFEQITIAITALTGSAEEAGRIMEIMKNLWRETGVSVAQQAGTIQKFLALGFSPGEAVKLGKNILDIAGSVGLAADQADLLGSALAQVKAKGVVSMEELRQQIAEKGVPVFEALGASMGVSQAQLMKLVSEGKVPAENLLKLFMNMEGSFAKFAGGSTRLGGTFLGMLERIKGTTQLVFAAFGAPIIDGLKPFLENAIARIDTLKIKATEIGNKIKNALNFARAASELDLLPELLGAGLQLAIIRAINTFKQGYREAVAYLSGAMTTLMASLKKSWGANELVGIFKDLGNGLAAAITAGILKGIDAIPGVDTTSDANREAKSAENSFNRAGNRLSDIDLGQTFADIAKSVIDANEAGKKSVRSLSAKDKNEDIVDETKARNFLEELKSLLAGRIARVDLNKIVEDTLKKNTSTDSTSTDTPTASKNLGTLTTSLGRVGGGGFGMTFFPMISEQKRSNTLLQSIVKNTAAKPAGAIPTTA